MAARSAELDGEGVWAAPLSAGAERPHGERAADAAARFRALCEEHVEFVWRSLRRLGACDADADDATQQVLLVAAQRLASIEPGRERAFLFATAMRVASHARRSARRRGEVPDEVADVGDDAPSAEELVDRRRARELLDTALDALEIEARAVFVLFELEGLTQVEIAGLLNLPQGTVASRLRRAREGFDAAVARLKAQGRWR